MKYLLDTHAWVWWDMRPQNLSRKVLNLIVPTAREEKTMILTKDNRIRNYHHVQTLW